MANEEDDRPLELPITTSKKLRSDRPRPTVVTSSGGGKISDPPVESPRDPRFDPRCSGSNDRRHFVRNYAFLNEAKQKEMQALNNALKREQDPEKKAKIKVTIARLRNKMISSESEFNLKRVRGKAKKVELAKKFQDLKQTGKLTKYLERKRKKLLKRDQKSLG